MAPDTRHAGGLATSSKRMDICSCTSALSFPRRTGEDRGGGNLDNGITAVCALGDAAGDDRDLSFFGVRGFGKKSRSAAAKSKLSSRGSMNALVGGVAANVAAAAAAVAAAAAATFDGPSASVAALVVRVARCRESMRELCCVLCLDESVAMSPLLDDF